MNIELLKKQSKVNKDFNRCIDIITPIISGKKITKREIDKANKALELAFGIFNTWTREYGERKGEIVNVPFYSVSKVDQYGSTNINIYASDRSIQLNDRTEYIPDYIKSIYLGYGKDSITTEDVMRYKYDEKYIPTPAQIERAYKKYEAISAQIKKLENDRTELPFYFYFNK